MALTARQAIEHIEHTLYQANSDIPAIEVVNTAGKMLYQMREWSFRDGGPATLSFVASQSYVNLATDFGTMTALQMTSGLVSRIWRVSLGELLEYRVLSQGNPRDFWCAVSWEIPSGETRLMPRLELYPTPTSNSANALTYFYKRRWVDATDDDEDLAVPDLAQSLYIRICRQVARSYEDEDVTAYTDTLNSLYQSMEYQMAVREDVNTQGSQGILANGISSSEFDRSGLFWDRSVNAPS